MDDIIDLLKLMKYRIDWLLRAVKQAAHLPARERARIVEAVDRLAGWPLPVADIRPIRGQLDRYRLRVGRYCVLFEVATAIQVIRVEEVKKRDERTYQRR